MWGDFVANVKEPIYMKWWAWVTVFLITALIVNYTAESEYALKTEQIKDHGELHSDLTQDIKAYDDEVTAVMATIDVDTDDSQNDITDYNTPATFLVATDIPIGEYFVMAGENKFGYILLTRSRNLNVREIIWQKHFENHTMVNLRAGVYLTTKNATLIPIDDAIVPNFENGTLHSGMYRVGVDIPPGIYTIFPLENKIGYFSTATSSHSLESHTLQRRNFSEPITIALNIGDYFTFMRAEIRK